MATEVGSAYVSIYPDTSKFTQQLSEGIVQGIAHPQSVVGHAMSNLLSSAVQGITSAIGDNFMRGVERFDTIQNFPKLMQTFGYSASDADKAVTQIANHLDGLPGSTDEVLRLVQSISDSTSSLGLATTTGLAFNDMLTAAGADAATVTTSMRIFDQIMGGGLTNITRWQALTSKMPLQFNMLAKEILGASASSEDLGRAIIAGDVSLEQLAQTMTDKMPEFEAQARAMSDGVGTAITNIPNRVAAGWAAILGVIGQGSIANAINGFSYGIRDAMKWIASGLEEFVSKHKIELTGFGYVLERVGAAVADTIKGLPWEDLQNVIAAGLNAVKDALKWMLDNGDIVLSVVKGIVVAVVGMKLGSTLNSIAGSVGKIIGLIAANPLAAAVIAIGAIVAALVNFFTNTERGRKIWAQFTKWLSETWASLKKTAAAVFKTMATTITNVWNGIKSTASAVWTGIKTVIMTPINALKSIVSTVFNAIKSTINTISTGIKSSTQTAWKGIQTFIENPIKAVKSFIETAFKAIKSAITGPVEAIGGVVDTVFGGLASFVGGAVSGAQSAINGFTGKSVDLKVTTTNVTNGVSSAKKSVGSFTGKTVELKANSGNVSAAVASAKKALSGLTDKKVNINFYGYQSGIRGVDISTQTTVAGNKRIAANPIRLYAAAGGIATKATAGIFGEAGDEALVPLSNRTKVRPFARAVAAEIPNSGGGVTVTGNTFIVRKDSDIPAIANAINTKVQRERVSSL